MIIPSRIPTTEAVENHYDSLEWFYLDTWGDHLHHGLWEQGGETTVKAVQTLSETVAGLAGIESGDTVCDIGCGHGGSAIHLAKTKQAFVSGITLSKKQCEEAERMAMELPGEIPKPRFFHGDWLENSFKTSSFDAAVSIECLSHLGDKPAFFREAARVLKPGGRLGMAVWLANPKAGPRAIRFLLKPICEEGRFPGLLSAEELKAVAVGEGFAVETFREVGKQVKKTWRIILGRLIWKVMTRREYLRFLWNNLRSDRIFPLTVLRVMLAYEIGALQYGLIGLVNSKADIA
ncbi:MAG: methyltransferase domain-containing protein [Verrucomicrobiales bacterium]|nr:methyltransferase domain-containing protein [Verrucomicrobiales bacterium]